MVVQNIFVAPYIPSPKGFFYKVFGDFDKWLERARSDILSKQMGNRTKDRKHIKSVFGAKDQRFKS
ncbi:MAG: hypothetical protein LBD29_07465 [Treponema sp.]|jgi:hypothetical protein|nr:hypothetical protein [Treponema sp.]